MKAFISDLHLGDGSKADDFHRTKEFIDFLDYIEPKVDELILLGDTFELWQCDLDKIYWHNDLIIDGLNAIKCKVTYIYGNHDFLPFSRLCAEFYRNNSLDIQAYHGHQLDEFNRYKNPLFALKWPIGKYITVLLGEIERWFHPDADIWAEKMKEKFSEFIWDAAELRNRKMTLEQAKTRTNRKQYIEIIESKSPYSINIFGHSHTAELEKCSKRIYANCGTWVDSETPTFITVDENEVRLCNGLTFEPMRTIERK